MSSPVWQRRRAGARAFRRYRYERYQKRKGRNRKRCTRIGHGPWFWTCGAVALNGQVVQEDSGRICQRCGDYVAETSWKAAA